MDSFSVDWPINNQRIFPSLSAASPLTEPFISGCFCVIQPLSLSWAYCRFWSFSFHETFFPVPWCSSVQSAAKLILCGIFFLSLLSSPLLLFLFRCAHALSLRPCANTHACVWTCASTWGSIPSRPRSGERQLYGDAAAIGIIGLLETNWSTALLWVASLIN